MLHVLGRVVDRFATAFDVRAGAGHGITSRYRANRAKYAQDHQYRKDLPRHGLFPCVMTRRPGSREGKIEISQYRDRGDFPVPGAGRRSPGRCVSLSLPSRPRQVRSLNPS